MAYSGRHRCTDWLHDKVQGTDPTSEQINSVVGAMTCLKSGGSSERKPFDLTRGNPEQQVVPVLECEVQAYRLPRLRTLAQVNPDFAADSTTALSRATLSTLPKEEHAVT